MNEPHLNDTSEPILSGNVASEKIGHDQNTDVPMFELYTANTTNGQRVSIMLEETEQQYCAYKVDLASGEQRSSRFLNLNPRGQIPVLVIHEPSFSSPFVLTQSISILQYLAEKTGRFLPESPLNRARAFEWMAFYATDLFPAQFHAFLLERRSNDGLQEAANQLREHAYDLYRHIDHRLSQEKFLAGAEYSIADIAVIPGIIRREEEILSYPNISRWLHEIKQRPAVQRGMAIPKTGE